MKYLLHEIKNGNPTHKIPSNFFEDLLEQFESRLTQYKKRIDEVEEILNASIEKESFRKRLTQDGTYIEDMDVDQQESTASLLYQVLHLLYQNFCTVSNQVEFVNEMVESRVLKIKKYWEQSTRMTNAEIEDLFEYKESESDTVIKDLNKLASKNNEKSTFKAFDRMSLDTEDDKSQIGRKRRAGEIPLISYAPTDNLTR